MDPNTGKIYRFENEDEMAEAKRRGFVQIPEKQLPHVQGMNRHERRAWAARQRRKGQAGG